MLEIRVEGDAHPKTFKLVTDDREAELDRLQEIIHDEIGADTDDPMRKWFDGHTADQFAGGVEIPTEMVGEVAEVLEGDWWDAAEVVDQQRREHEAQLDAE